jgi:preprotein translocase subunit SecE
MARQTRAQRRARRQQHSTEPAIAGAGGRGEKPPVRLAPEPPARPEPGRPRRGFTRFVGESYGELRKVEWPTQRHVIQGTVVVLIACIIVGSYLWLADVVSKYVVENILIK